MNLPPNQPTLTHTHTHTPTPTHTTDTHTHTHPYLHILTDIHTHTYDCSALILRGTAIDIHSVVILFNVAIMNFIETHNQKMSFSLVL